MKHIYSLAIIFGLYFAGELIVRLTGIFLPAGIIGMLLLFALLCARVVKIETIRETGAFLIDNMMLFILPATVGIVTAWQLIADKFLLYIIMNVLTTLLIFAVTGKSAQALICARKRKEAKRHGRS